MIKRIDFQPLSRLIRKRHSVPKASRIINILVLTLLVLSSFVSVLVNPGPAHAAVPESFYKLPYPTADPAGYGYGVAFGYDGTSSTYVAIVNADSPYVNIYKKGSGDTFAKLSDPTGGLPTASMSAVAFSPNATYLATAGGSWGGANYLTVYKRSGETFSKLTVAQPGGSLAYAVAFSPDGNFMAVGRTYTGTPTGGIEVYKITTGDTFTKLTTGVDELGSTGNGIAFSHDSAYLAVASTSGYTTTYSITGSDIFTKLTNPTEPPSGTSNGVAFSHDSAYLAVAHNTSPYITVYSHAAGVLTKLGSQPAAPAGAGNGVAFSHDSGYLAVAHETTPYITVYSNSGGAFPKVTDPHSLPTSTGYGVTFSQDSSYLALACPTSNKLWLYKKTTIPTVTAAGTSTDGTKIILTFSKAMADPSDPRHDSFKYQYSGDGDENIDAAVLNADTTKIELTPRWPILAGEVITVSYTYSESNGDVTAADYGVLADFTPIAVTNNVPVPPTVVSAATNTTGTVITITFNKDMADPASKQAEFKYRHSGSDQSFSAAALNVDHTKIDLTCAGTTIAYGDTVYVDYTKGTVLAEDGAPLDTFTYQAVTNNLAVPPTVSSATTNAAGTVITVTFNKNMADPAGKHGDFKYKIGLGGAVQSFSAAALNATTTKIDLTCSGTPIVYGNAVYVNYTKGTVKAADDGMLASFTNQSVTNAMPIPPPIFVSAATNAAGTVITITFNKAMANPSGKQASFTYKIGGVAAGSFSVAALNATTTKIDLTCSGTAIASGNSVTVSYTAGTVAASDGGVLATFTDQAVSNNMPGPPTFVSAATNAAGTAMTITFNKDMANPAGKHGDFKYKINGGAVQSFSAAALNATITKIDLTCSGTAIAYGNTVTVSYTAGTVAASDGGVLATFTDQAVSNNMPGPASTVALTAVPSSIVANGTSTSALTATVRDEHGNPVADGTNVVFATSKGSVGSLTITKTTTNGVATATLISSTTAAVADITATADGVSATGAVIFAPAGAPVTQSKTQTVSGSGTVTNTPTGGDVTINGTGNHTLTTAKYGGNPGGTPSFQASGNYYDVHLDSATNVNSITVQFCPGVSPTVIYYWNGTSWVAASNQSYSGECIVVTVTAISLPSLADLSGLFFGSGIPTPEAARSPAPAPTPPRPRASPTPQRLLNPAQMSVQYLSVSPQQTSAGQPVTISTNVVNTGDEAGSYNVALKINGKVEQTKMVSVGPQGTQPVKFTVPKAQPGTYTIDIGGQRGSFIITGSGSGTARAPTNSGLIALLIIGVLVLITIVALIARRRPA
jgi:uncharacterized repeat protein (TIGR02059 family)